MSSDIAVWVCVNTALVLVECYFDLSCLGKGCLMQGNLSFDWFCFFGV